MTKTTYALRPEARHFPWLLPPAVLEDHRVAMGGAPLNHHGELVLLHAALLFGRHLHLALKGVKSSNGSVFIRRRCESVELDL